MGQSLKRTLDPGLLSGALSAAAVIFGAILLREPLQTSLAAASVEEQFERLILLHATLPRITMAILCGAGLALSGTILQQVLRNPLVAPDTVAVNAGARLALALAAVLAPGLLGFGRDLVAIAGAAVTTLLVLAIAGSRRYSPLSMILAGLVVSLYCGAASTVLVLLKDRYLVGLFIWGSGSLSQQSWEPAIQLALRLLACGLPLTMLMRPLSVMDAGEEAAHAVGVPVERVRIFAVGLAVLMAAFVTSAVGVIGFIGLAAPALATLCGAERFVARCFWSTIFGALLLVVTDLAVQVIGGDGGAFIPTGAVTAVIGSPLLLVFLSRLRSHEPQLLAVDASMPVRAPRPALNAPVWAFLAAGAFLCLCFLPLIGRAPDGSWFILPADMFGDVMPWRLPRTLGAAGAGGLLAIGGYILQRVTQNPMASPEIIGVSAGAIMGAAIVLALGGAASEISLGLAAAAGSFAALVFVLNIAFRGPAAPERMLLAGVALTALVDAAVGVFSASGSPSAVLLLAWMAGSAGGVDMTMAASACAAALIFLCVALLGSRWLAVLPLGTPVAAGVGVRVPLALSSLFALVAVMTAIATPVIGPLTFVGLMAPHMVRLLGVRSAPAGLVASALTGAALMTIADSLARTIAFPLQLPTGVLASLISGPILLLLIAKGRKQ